MVSRENGYFFNQRIGNGLLDRNNIGSRRNGDSH